MSSGIKIPYHPHKRIISEELIFRIQAEFVTHYDDDSSQVGMIINRGYLNAPDAIKGIEEMEQAFKGRDPHS